MNWSARSLIGRGALSYSWTLIFSKVPGQPLFQPSLGSPAFEQLERIPRRCCHVSLPLLCGETKRSPGCCIHICFKLKQQHWIKPRPFGRSSTLLSSSWDVPLQCNVYWKTSTVGPTMPSKVLEWKRISIITGAILSWTVPFRTTFVQYNTRFRAIINRRSDRSRSSDACNISKL